MFQSAAPSGNQVAQLWWILLGVSLFVFIGLIAALIWALIHKRKNEELSHGDRALTRSLFWASFLTVLILFVSLVALYQYPAPNIERGQKTAITVEVTGKLWWWKIKYFSELGEYLFETANEIYIPTGTPVRLKLLSNDVIHSFWIPKIAGKVDMIPGHTNYLWIESTRKGKFRGQCAEYCGLQHAKMGLWVHAVSPKEFEEWVEHQRSPAPDPQGELSHQGKRVYVEAGCIRCHTIRNDLILQDLEIQGPDLTHLASRGTLGAASVPNNRGHLAAWVADSQGIKPGNLMPAFPLKSEDFNALMHFLEGLK